VSGSAKPAKSGSSEDRFILFVSFSYFGGSSENAELGLERESVKPQEFKRLGVVLVATGAQWVVRGVMI